MSHPKSREVVLAIAADAALDDALADLRLAWQKDPAGLPKGLAGSVSRDGQFVVAVAESAFAILPGACIIKGLGALRLLGDEPVLEPGAGSASLVLKSTAEGWRFSIKYVPPIVRQRNLK